MSPAATSPESWHLVACAAGAVVLLLILIARVRLHPALALATAALALGVAAGMPLKQVPLSFTAGVGNLMGHIAIVLGMGAILGRLLAGSGGAAALGRVLVENCGPKGLPWALLGLGILVGMPVFFEVGLVLLMPIVAEAARRTDGRRCWRGCRCWRGSRLCMARCRRTRRRCWRRRSITPIWGAPFCGGWWRGCRRRPLPGRGWAGSSSTAGRSGEKAAPGGGAEALPLFAATAEEEVQIERREEAAAAHVQAPNDGGSRAGWAGRAAAAILLPIALIFLGSWADSVSAAGSVVNQILHFIGSPDIALLIAVLAALVTLGPRIQTGRHHGRELLRKLTAESFEPIAGVLVILAAAGGLSGVLRDSGAAQATVSLALGAHMPPLVLAWLLAAVVRVSMGSATVAMAVASSVLAPLATMPG